MLRGLKGAAALGGTKLAISVSLGPVVAHRFFGAVLDVITFLLRKLVRIVIHMHPECLGP